MIPNMPTIAAKFDIRKAGGGLYGVACWKIFWEAISSPQDIGVALLFEGDTAATLNLREKVFCIAVQTPAPERIAAIKAALTQNEAFRRVCARQMFLEGPSCLEEPLVNAGRLDAKGNLLGGLEADMPRCALAETRREQNGRRARRSRGSRQGAPSNGSAKGKIPDKQDTR